MTVGTRSILLTLIATAVLAGTLDLIFATSFWSLRGVPPQRILQSIAAGAQGAGAYGGGTASAVLGVTLHYLIATCMVLVFYLASRRWPVLVEFPWLAGCAYGVLLYLVMTWVVVPLSAAPAPRPAPVDLSWVLASIAAHMLLVGLPCAWAAWRLRT